MIETYPAYALDIDYELCVLERYFETYNPLPLDVQRHLRFIPAKRFPLEPKDKEYREFNPYERRQPYAPYLCIRCVENYVMYNVYANSPYYKLFKQNPYLKSGRNFLSDYYGTETNDPDPIQTIITSWLKTDKIPIEHYKMIDIMLSKILQKVVVYTNLYPNHIWELNYKTTHVILLNHGDIKAFRFDELKDLR